MIDIQGRDYSSAIAPEGGHSPRKEKNPLETEEILMVVNRSRLTLEREIYWLRVGTLEEAEALPARSFTVVSMIAHPDLPKRFRIDAPLNE